MAQESSSENTNVSSRIPDILAGLGGIVCLVGLITAKEQFAFSYLLGFMMILSLGLGSLFLVLVHHLFDANWSVPVRRINEHIACLLPVLGILFIPFLFLCSGELYHWMSIEDPTKDHALAVKRALFNVPTFFGVSIVLFAIWGWLSWSLRGQSLAQDKSGAASHTGAMRKLSAGGIFIFAFSLTLAAIFWVKGLEHQWFSTMYGVYYFAESVWITLATLYVVIHVLKEKGPLKHVIHRHQVHSVGTLMLAFTVFYAYIHFSQYFLIWNAAIPEETFWYVKRDSGTWRAIGLILVFGHFFIPFLLLLPIANKLFKPLMFPLIGFMWVMHYCDLAFNITPVLHPEGFHVSYLDFAALAFIGGVGAKVFLRWFNNHPAYPQRDPRMAESMGVYIQPLSERESGGAE